MATKNYRIDTAAGLKALEPRREPYWRKITAGRYIGYRKLRDGTGSWIARFTTADRKQKYLSLSAGIDYQEADKEARRFFEAQDKGGDSRYTLQQAIDDYVEDRRAAKGAGVADKARKDLTRHIPSALLRLPVAKLTTRQLINWRNSLVKSSDDPDELRRSRATANRYWSTFRACLNLAAKGNRALDRETWRAVGMFEGVDEARKVILTDEQARKLLEVTRGGFRDLCEAALLTGARYGELASMLVEDFDPTQGTVRVRKGKTGARDIHLSDAGVETFKRYAKGKLPRALLLPKDDGTRWDASHQQVPFRRAVEAAGLPRDTVLYSLRHTHISRACLAGIPVQVIAENCGTSILMIQRHYAKFLGKDRRNLMNRMAEVTL